MKTNPAAGPGPKLPPCLAVATSAGVAIAKGLDALSGKGKP